MSQKIICILGMHRSGTSCLAGSLQGAGVFLGEVHTHNRHNLKGNREHIYLNQLQEQVLQENGGSWHNPPKNVQWSEKHLKKLWTITAHFKEYPVWGFKDPRTLFTNSGIQQIIGDIQFVGTFRNPVSVVASLQRRNSELGDEKFWLNLWNRYNKRLLDLWLIHRFPIVNFDNNDEVYLTSLSTLYEQLGLKKSTTNTSAVDGAEHSLIAIPTQKPTQFFDPSLRSEIEFDVRHIPNDIRKTYDELQRIAL